MQEHRLAEELWPQLQRIAEAHGYRRVARVDMIVGMLQGVTAESLARSFQHAFMGSGFAGAAMNITVVGPGDEITPPGWSETTAANGWELLITCIEGGG